MRLLKQSGQFFVIGLAQLGLDWLIFVAATASGIPVVPANILGRICSAMMGFWLNGRFTFASEGGAQLGWHRFSRYVVVWLTLTLVSTWAVGTLAAGLGLKLAWLAKPVVEAFLAGISFVLMRFFVFR